MESFISRVWPLVINKMLIGNRHSADLTLDERQRIHSLTKANARNGVLTGKFSVL